MDEQLQRINELERDIADMKHLNGDLYRALTDRGNEMYALQRELSDMQRLCQRNSEALQEKTRQYDALLSVVNIAPHLATENEKLKQQVQQLTHDTEKCNAALSEIYDALQRAGYY
jgi:methyl-accepting chemotaxis protein